MERLVWETVGCGHGTARLLMSTLGVYYAAKGSAHADGMRAALRSVRRMPMVYGAIVGMLFHTLHIPICYLEEGVNLIADAAILLIMITYRMKLANIQLKTLEVNKVLTVLVEKVKTCTNNCCFPCLAQASGSPH